jgi:hypothetical protein
MMLNVRDQLNTVGFVGFAYFKGWSSEKLEWSSKEKLALDHLVQYVKKLLWNPATNGRTDKVPYRGAMLAPKKLQLFVYSKYSLTFNCRNGLPYLRAPSYSLVAMSQALEIFHGTSFACFE